MHCAYGRFWVGFNTQPPEGGWRSFISILRIFFVSTHSRPKAAGFKRLLKNPVRRVSTHSRPKAAGDKSTLRKVNRVVSTHSRPKAAGLADNMVCEFLRGFNTQPPEGGWPPTNPIVSMVSLFQHTAARRRLDSLSSRGAGWTKFQHTAARRRLALVAYMMICRLNVSTHSRPKAAGTALKRAVSLMVGFNTQPPEGGWLNVWRQSDPVPVSTHSRPKAAGSIASAARLYAIVSTHSRPKAAGTLLPPDFALSKFQHTAARRRLGYLTTLPTITDTFQHTAAQRRLGIRFNFTSFPNVFQHTAARRRLGTEIISF